MKSASTGGGVYPSSARRAWPSPVRSSFIRSSRPRVPARYAAGALPKGLTLPASKEPSHRLPLSRIVELLLQRGGDHSTVSLSRNAKGGTQIDVQVRAAPNAEFATLADAVAAAKRTYDELRRTYPLEDAREPASVTLTRNAKGETQVSVEVKTTGEHGSLNTEQAGDEAAGVYEGLRAKFPVLSGAVGS